MLTHVGSLEGFEGAEKATKYYQRNLRMYFNLNRIELSGQSIYIIGGESHSIF